MHFYSLLLQTIMNASHDMGFFSLLPLYKQELAIILGTNHWEKNNNKTFSCLPLSKYDSSFWDHCRYHLNKNGILETSLFLLNIRKASNHTKKYSENICENNKSQTKHGYHSIYIQSKMSIINTVGYRISINVSLGYTNL